MPIRLLYRRVLLWVCLCGLPALAAASVPPVLKSPLHIWVGEPVGGLTDQVARLVAEYLEPQLGVPVIVESRTGASGRLAAQGVSEASSDENVLLFSPPASVVVAPAIFRQLGYDPLRNLTPVALVAYFEFGLAASPGANLERVEDLPQWVRANPLAFNIGLPGAGTLPYFFAIMLDDLIPQSAEYINYRNSTHLLADLMTDRLPLAIDTLDALTPAHRSGKAHVLATSGPQRHPDFPDIPTFREAGLDLEADGWFAFFAPGRMPHSVMRELGEQIAQTLRNPNLNAALDELGLIPAGLGPTDSVAIIEEYRTRWVPIIQASGYRVTY
ncbi:MAG: tripartite tricarboxylate transporter substrate-binding protein [Pigmentiphaga sp.]